METKPELDILDLLKALADESRLQLLRTLYQGEATVGDLARGVELGEPTVSHHLTRLREAGLVTLRMAGNQRYYRVNETGLANFKRLAAQIEQPLPPLEPARVEDGWIYALGWLPEEEQTLRKYTQGTRLARVPVKEKDLKVILRWLATLFTPERLYTEVEVNGLLKPISADEYVTLRRELVDYGYLRRERGGGKYWLAPADGDQPAVN
jgi:DNA-binding transcriptional ArsR family regulator